MFEYADAAAKDAPLYASTKAKGSGGADDLGPSVCLAALLH